MLTVHTFDKPAMRIPALQNYRSFLNVFDVARCSVLTFKFIIY